MEGEKGLPEESSHSREGGNPDFKSNFLRGFAPADEVVLFRQKDLVCRGETLHLKIPQSFIP